MRQSYTWSLYLGVTLVVAGAEFGQQAATAAGETARHPFTSSDWAALRSAKATAVSPNGSILYDVTFGADKGPMHNEWWTIAADGSHAAKLELSDDFSPTGFTADGGGLYGAFKVNKDRQLAIFPIKENKAAAVPMTLVLLPRGFVSATASPDGKRFAMVADPRAQDAVADVRHVIEPDQASLYVVNTDGTGGGWWCSGLTDVTDLLWSTEGASVVLLSQVPRIGHHEVSSAIDVCSATSVRHVTDLSNVATGLAWSDKGKEIAFLSTRSEVLTPEHVWTVATTGGTATDRTPELQGTAMQLSGDPQGHVWVEVNRGVQSSAEEFTGDVLKPVYRWQEGVVAGLPVTSEYLHGSGQIALNVGDPNHAMNVAVPEGDHLHKITHEGDSQLATIELGNVQAVHWKSKEGIALEGIATFPSGYSAGQKHPFLVLPHGGPESNDTLRLDAFPRMIAGLGYVVLQPEYRGSTGYGEGFLQAIYQHYGDRSFRDVDSATDYAIEQGWADPNRLAIFGWSAGGFMTSWTVTQTGRYKAAIEGAGITDWAPFLWTSDISQVDYDARWTDEAPEVFRKFSAVAFAAKVTTPLLILHGEADERVPTFQGTEYFQLLAARGKTVRMVTYPGSPHFPRLWEQRINVMQEMTAWLEKYNKD